MTENTKKSTGAPTTDHRDTPKASAFQEFIASNWEPAADDGYTRERVADFAAQRRKKISQKFPGERLVLPAGPLKVRSNDCDYRFRPHSAFAHQTGLGVDHEADAVLVFEPVDEGTGDNGSNHEVTLYFRPLAGRDTTQFLCGCALRRVLGWSAPPRSRSFQSVTVCGRRTFRSLKLRLRKNGRGSGVGAGVRNSDWCVRLIPSIDALVDTFPVITRALRWRNPISSILS